MLIDYDRRANMSIDQKLQSLIDSIHMALNEIKDEHYTKDEIDNILKNYAKDGD